MCNALRLMQNKYFKLSGWRECESEPCTKPVRSIEKGDIRENLDLRKESHEERVCVIRSGEIHRRRRPFSLTRHNRKWKLWMEGTIKVFLLLYYAAWWLFDNMWWTIDCFLIF